MPDDTALAALEARIGYTFKDRATLRQALTHRSWLEERHPGGAGLDQASQQRLEFLGDAALGYIVGRWLFDERRDASPGDLTKLRAALVQGRFLASKAETLGLREIVLLGRGEAMNTSNTQVLEDTLEAILGAIVLDSGLDAADRVDRAWLPEANALNVADATVGDPISAYNDWHMKKYKQAPPKPYEEFEGPDQPHTWTLRTSLDGMSFQAEGRSKADAKRALYEQLLRHTRFVL